MLFTQIYYEQVNLMETRIKLPSLKLTPSMYQTSKDCLAKRWKFYTLIDKSPNNTLLEGMLVNQHNTELYRLPLHSRPRLLGENKKLKRNIEKSIVKFENQSE